MDTQVDVMGELIPDGIEMVGDVPHMRDPKGRLVPVNSIKPHDKLIDQTVRTIMGHAMALSAQCARFKGHTFEDIGTTLALLKEEYGVAKGGAKGNVTLMSHDGLYKVQLQVADLIDFGPELLAAKDLIDECLNEWTEDAQPELRAIVTRAFNTDKPGQVNRAELFMLLRLDITDARWVRAMDAIRDAIRIVGSKEYVRFHHRDAPEGQWQPVSIDLAKV
ncbi:MAG: DUF3164 family protein [Shimia sp.]